MKTLADQAAAQINTTRQVTTVSALAALAPPAMSSQQAGFNHPPRQGAELRVFEVPVQLVGAKVEADSDIHLVVSDGAKTMVVEFPVAACVANDNATAKAAITQARSTFESACGRVGGGSMIPLTGNAVIDGVGFYDKDHGQTGRANVGNGWDVELHPVLSFSTSGCSTSGAALAQHNPNTD